MVLHNYLLALRSIDKYPLLLQTLRRYYPWCRRNVFVNFHHSKSWERNPMLHLIQDRIFASTLSWAAPNPSQALSRCSTFIPKQYHIF